MLKNFKLFIFVFVLVFIVDQAFKFYMLYLQSEQNNEDIKAVLGHLQDGFAYPSLYISDFMDLKLVLNKGVAFSMFAFLQGYLKFIHLALIVVLFIYLFYQKSFLKEHNIAFAMILSAGSSNLLDRFVYDGVVDMFFWHKWFEFAIFNLADVMINIGVALVLIKEIFFKRKKNV